MRRREQYLANVKLFMPTNKIFVDYDLVRANDDFILGAVFGKTYYIYIQWRIYEEGMLGVSNPTENVRRSQILNVSII